MPPVALWYLGVAEAEIKVEAAVAEIVVVVSLEAWEILDVLQAT
jgi:hypothetical protein